MSGDLETLQVRDVMKIDFDLVEGKETVSHALLNMQHHEAGMLIVKKRSDDDEYGVVLMSDIASNILASDRAPERVNIYEIMIKPALSVRASMNIRYCARLFKRFGISKAPVFDGDEVIGIVSNTDMVMKCLDTCQTKAK